MIFLTDPTTGTFCYGGKKIWKDKHFPSVPLYMAAQKWRLARKGHVLIDDKLSNIRDFNNHGGWGMIFPQPWNDSKNLIGQDTKRMMQYIGFWLSQYVDTGEDRYV